MRTLPVLYKVPRLALSAPLAPNFSIFHPFFKKFFIKLAQQCPPCAESPRRTLVPPKNPGISRQNAPSTPRRRPKTPRKTPLQSPEKPVPHTPPRKKLSKVHSTLLTPLPRECILEYMRLKEPRRPPHAERRAQHRPPPKLSNYPASH